MTKVHRWFMCEPIDFRFRFHLLAGGRSGIRGHDSLRGGTEGLVPLAFIPFAAGAIARVEDRTRRATDSRAASPCRRSTRRQRLIKTIDVGAAQPDGIYFHAFNRRVYVFSHPTKDATACTAGTAAGGATDDGDSECDGRQDPDRPAARRRLRRAVFNPSTMEVFSTHGNGTLTVVKEISGPGHSACAPATRRPRWSRSGGTWIVHDSDDRKVEPERAGDPRRGTPAPDPGLSPTAIG